MTNPLSEQNVPESLKNIETGTKPSKTVKQDVKQDVKNESAKDYTVVSSEDLKNKVSDVEVYGNPDLFVCISKASSKSGRWMKSTKVMEVPGGCVLQVTTQQGDNIAEAVTFVPGTMLEKDTNGNYKLVQYRRAN